MRRSLLIARLPLVTALVVAPFMSPYAQSNAQNASPAKQAGNPATLKVLNLDDYGPWNRISAAALSHDGKWMTFTYTPNEGGDPVLHVKALDGDKDYSTSLGAAPGAGGGRAGGGRGGAGGPRTARSCSDDRRWAA